MTKFLPLQSCHDGKSYQIYSISDRSHNLVLVYEAANLGQFQIKFNLCIDVHMTLMEIEIYGKLKINFKILMFFFYFCIHFSSSSSSSSSSSCFFFFIWRSLNNINHQHQHCYRLWIVATILVSDNFLFFIRSTSLMSVTCV